MDVDPVPARVARLRSERTRKKCDSALLFEGDVILAVLDYEDDALAALDDNGDGVLSGKELDGLALWHDANGNGVCDPGEVKPLSEYIAGKRRASTSATRTTRTGSRSRRSA